MSIKNLVDKNLEIFNHQQNSYIKSLVNHEIEKDDFIETQIQFFSAVTFFSRPMSLLVAKIPRPQERIEILKNIWDEHGEGDPENFHRHTFLVLLERLGSIKEEDVYRRVLWPEVRQFNTTLIGATLMDEFLVGLSCMGMIERMFIEISSLIGNFIIDSKWLSREQMIHYNLHETLDIEHAQGFFDVISPYLDRPGNDYYIEQGLMLGAQSFLHLFDGLYQGRKRRWIKDHPLSHWRQPF
jgi:pyrroloquinoline quinone (PQQ) biosynthesis protein C